MPAQRLETTALPPCQHTVDQTFSERIPPGLLYVENRIFLSNCTELPPSMSSPTTTAVRDSIQHYAQVAEAVSQREMKRFIEEVHEKWKLDAQ